MSVRSVGREVFGENRFPNDGGGPVLGVKVLERGPFGEFIDRVDWVLVQRKALLGRAMQQLDAKTFEMALGTLNELVQQACSARKVWMGLYHAHHNIGNRHAVEGDHWRASQSYAEALTDLTKAYSNEQKPRFLRKMEELVAKLLPSFQASLQEVRRRPQDDSSHRLYFEIEAKIKSLLLHLPQTVRGDELVKLWFQSLEPILAKANGDLKKEDAESVQSGRSVYSELTQQLFDWIMLNRVHGLNELVANHPILSKLTEMLQIRGELRTCSLFNEEDLPHILQLCNDWLAIHQQLNESEQGRAVPEHEVRAVQAIRARGLAAVERLDQLNLNMARTFFVNRGGDYLSKESKDLIIREFGRLQADEKAREIFLSLTLDAFATIQDKLRQYIKGLLVKNPWSVFCASQYKMKEHPAISAAVLLGWVGNMGGDARMFDIREIL